MYRLLNLRVQTVPCILFIHIRHMHISLSHRIYRGHFIISGKMLPLRLDLFCLHYTREFQLMYQLREFRLSTVDGNFGCHGRNVRGVLCRRHHRGHIVHSIPVLPLRFLVFIMLRLRESSCVHRLC